MKEDKKIDGWHPVIFFGEKNKNGRIYTNDSMNKDVIEKINDRIHNKQFFGELGHPDRGDAIITLDKISHEVEDVETKDNIVFAKIKILDTPNGNLLELLPEGSVVFRPRGIGSVDDDGIVDLKQIIAFDAIYAGDDAFKDMQDMYKDMLMKDLCRTTDVVNGRVDLDDVDKAFKQKSDDNGQ